MNPTDFIVVGAGSAGCVVARGLAERGFHVRLLEAGPPAANPASDRPAYYPRLFGSALDWGFHSQRQVALAGRRLPQPRGRGPGGSTLLNAMIWMPPTAADREALATAGGAAWQPAVFDQAVQAIEAWVRPENPRWLGEGSRQFLTLADTALEAFPHRRMNQLGRRRTAADVLAESPAASRVCRQVALVDRLEIQAQRVVGVRLHDAAAGTQGTKWLTAKRGVILAAGTFQSPAILMRSGIGPAAELRRCGIEVRRDVAAVGAGLTDHLVMPVVYSTPALVPFRLPRALRDVARWQTMGSGPLTSNLAEVGGFASVTVASRDTPATVQFHVTPTDYLRYPADGSTAAMTLAVTDSQPRSRGRVGIDSSDAAAPPRIDPGYLTDDSDLDVLVAGVRLARSLAARLPAVSGGGQETLPGRRRDEDQGIAKAVRRFAQTLYHPVGTCALGQATQSVVDPELRLRGVEGCWVVDASVLPMLPIANPNATVMALAYHFSRGWPLENASS
ncbi:GMC family oxidoreductase [Roseimaritima ulvae]|uniref:Alcohol dehydrogenase [acceptor] n=1 Tax=Roseimaritima ulvae TaxID=980254 RepID=A0A5B9QIZ6_9BACT|nr:GMC family oxidoreductase [Roseimaritima ulvae]QEG38874.1 Alcohol dehydrogenase [acceptor] [Roseimaritima ulvae]